MWSLESAQTWGKANLRDMTVLVALPALILAALLVGAWGEVLVFWLWIVSFTISGGIKFRSEGEPMLLVVVQNTRLLFRLSLNLLMITLTLNLVTFLMMKVLYITFILPVFLFSFLTIACSLFLLFNHYYLSRKREESCCANHRRGLDKGVSR